MPTELRAALRDAAAMLHEIAPAAFAIVAATEDVP